MASTLEVSVEGAIEEISKITQGEATESDQVLEYYDKYAEQVDFLSNEKKTQTSNAMNSNFSQRRFRKACQDYTLPPICELIVSLTLLWIRAYQVSS